MPHSFTTVAPKDRTMRRKKFRFNVKLCVEELASVPFVSGILFTKIRLEDGRKLTDFTTREEVRNHTILWNKSLEFPCKLSATSETGVLDKCLCRLSVRKETKGGRTYQKLGYVDLNLSEYAGQGSVSKNFILLGYNDKHRLDNSTLRVNIHMTLTSGDPLFKVPTATDIADLSPPSRLSSELSVEGDCEETSSSGFDSLTHQQRDTILHSRNPSAVSDISGYGTGSRSMGGQRENGHIRNPSSGSNTGFLSLRKNAGNERAERIDSTRVDTNNLVDELFGGLSLDDSQDGERTPANSATKLAHGLQLYLGQDGSAAVTGHTADGQTIYTPVPLEQS